MLKDATITTTIAVTDLNKARAFYGKTLGLKEVQPPDMPEEGGAVFESRDSKLYVYVRPTPGGSTATCCSFDVADVDGVVQALRKNGVKFEDYNMPEAGIKTENGIATMGDMKAAWFKDPFGNILAIGNMKHLEGRRGESVAQTR